MIWLSIYQDFFTFHTKFNVWLQIIHILKKLLSASSLPPSSKRWKPGISGKFRAHEKTMTKIIRKEHHIIFLRHDIRLHTHQEDHMSIISSINRTCHKLRKFLQDTHRKKLHNTVKEQVSISTTNKKTVIQNTYICWRKSSLAWTQLCCSPTKVPIL